jgi:TIR domain-containing protein
MNDIFISYDSADRAKAQKFADALESLGWSVWWDREIPLGKAFDQVIEEELNAARCVIVLWSKEAVRSRWVKTEAAAAADRECLIPVLIEDVSIPFEFKRIQTAMLMNWQGDAADPEFIPLIQAIRQLLGQTQPARPLASQQSGKVTSRAPAWLASRGWLIGVAAIVIVVAGAIAIKNSPQKSASLQGSSTEPAGSPQPAASSATAERAGRHSKPSASNGVFSIKIGDKIADGAPGPGAGAIESPYNQDVYVFGAAAKQRVYFHQLRHSTGLSYIKWRLTDADGAEIFNTCLGCGEPGVQILTKGGSYTLTVGSDNDASTGTYELQLFAVAVPSQFSIKVGDTVKEGVPGAGAGVIESPGAEDIYSFNATPRQSVYFRMWEFSTGLSYIKWKLIDDNGMEVFDTCLGCGEPGAQVLVRGGIYTLAVGNQKDPSSGTYRLQLSNIPPPDRYSIKIGDRIKPGIPGTGAGRIEVPGAEDIYQFSAAPGQKVYFHLSDRGKGMEYLQWRLVDDNGMELFNTCLACSEPGVQTLTKGGIYTLTVGNLRNPATGDYAFELGSR